MAGSRSSHGKRPNAHSDYNDNGRSKRRNIDHDRGKISITSDDTVYRYLCPSNVIGNIMGRGGDIVNQLRSESNSRIKIGETVSGCEERVITIYSTSNETNNIGGTNRVCPAQDALLKVHERVTDNEEYEKTPPQVTARLLVPSDQMGYIIGKGGYVVQGIRTDTGAKICILKDTHLPTCALETDELVQISGKASVVRKALFQIALRLHGNPSRSENLSVYPSGGYKGENGDWGRMVYPVSRCKDSSKEFSLRLICRTANRGSVIGKGGSIINRITEESGAAVSIDRSAAEAEDCIISISAKETYEDAYSPTIEAATRVQSRCSERVEKDSGLILYTTRLLVPKSEIGCLIGKGGEIISEIRRSTKAHVRIISKENLPKVVKHDDHLVQICADLDVAKDALVHVASRLRANLFFPVFTHLPEVSRYESGDFKRCGRGNSYSRRYGSSNDLPLNDGYKRSYGGLQGRTRGDSFNFESRRRRYGLRGGTRR